MKKGFDYIGVTVCFYCHDGKGNVLLQKRSNKCRDEHQTWDCGGGSMEFGESFEETALREIREEYCCKPLKLTYCGVNNVIRMHNNQKTHWVCIIFAAQLNPTEVGIGDPEKMEEIRWFPKDKLPSPLHSMYLPHFKFIINSI